ncbi:hypothetical protein D9M73_78730 [compost metagenome]
MKSGCWERRLCRARAMASPPSPRSRPMRVTPDSLKYKGRLRHPSLTLTPQKARHGPASESGTGTAALRLQASLFVLASGQQGALGRAAWSEERLFSSLYPALHPSPFFATVAWLRQRARVRCARCSPGPYAALRAAASAPALARCLHPAPVVAR